MMLLSNGPRRRGHTVVGGPRHRGRAVVGRRAAGSQGSGVMDMGPWRGGR
jgi:hypothetical protein